MDIDILNKRDLHLQHYTVFLIRSAEKSANLRCFQKTIKTSNIRFQSHSGDIKCSNHKYLATLLYNCDKTMYNDRKNILQILEMAHSDAISNMKNNIDSLRKKYDDLDQKLMDSYSKLQYAEQYSQEALYTQTYCELERIKSQILTLNRNYNYRSSAFDDSIHAYVNDICFRPDKPYAVIDIGYKS